MNVRYVLATVAVVCVVIAGFQNCAESSFIQSTDQKSQIPVTSGCSNDLCPTTCTGPTCVTPVTPDSCLISMAPVQSGVPPASGAGIQSLTCPAGYTVFDVVSANCAVGNTGANLEHFGRSGNMTDFYVACDMGNDGLYDGGMVKVLCMKTSCPAESADFYLKQNSVGVAQNGSTPFAILNTNVNQPTSVSCNGNDILIGIVSMGCAGDDLSVVGSLHSITSSGNSMQISCDAVTPYYNGSGFGANDAYHIYGGGVEARCMSATSKYANRIYQREGNGLVATATCNPGDTVIGITSAAMASANSRYFTEGFETTSQASASTLGLPSVFASFQKSIRVTCLKN